MRHLAKPTTVDGHRFASIGEAARYSELRILEMAGEIEQLELQPRFPLVVGGNPIGAYTADFAYIEGEDYVIEEYKGAKRMMSRDAMLRMRLFHALLPSYRYVVSDERRRAVPFDEWAKPVKRRRRKELGK